VKESTGFGLFDVTVRRPVAILMVTVAAVVFGIFSYRLLSVELMPDISYPSLTVRTEYSGAAPEEVEENVVRPLEEALGVVGGLVRLSSVSRAGLGDVTLEFTWDTEMSQAWQEVTERLDGIFLPNEADKPLILRYDPSLDPVIRLVLASSVQDQQGPAGLKRLRTFAEQELKRNLEQVEGVAAIRVLGGLEEQISVDLQEEALRRTGLSIQEVVRRLSAENVNLAGGDIREGDTRYLVRTVNEFQNLDEIEELVIARVQDRDVRLRDLGTVRSGWADRVVITRLHQAEAVELELQKEADSNIVSMAAAVKQSVAGLQKELPEGWSLEVVSDRSTFIRASVDEVIQTAVLGGLLAILVLYLFLRDFRITAVISVAIPVSVAAVFAPMNLSGLTLNIMSLGGLALGIGMLVDSGIVVVESISRCREEGDSNERAVARGTSEVGTAVIASTLTTVAVFFPMVFVEGVAGQVFSDLALTVVFALLASLLVSIFLVPALVARVADQGSEGTTSKLSIPSRMAQALRFRSLEMIQPDSSSALARLFSWLLPLVPFLLMALWLLKPDFPDTGGSAAGMGGRHGMRGRSGMGGEMPAPEMPAVEWSNLFLTLFGLVAVMVLAAVLIDGVLKFQAGRTFVRKSGALVLSVLLGPLLIVLESIWRLVIWALILIIGPLVLAVWLVLRLLKILLWPLLALFDIVFGFLQRLYPLVIRAALANQVYVLALAAVCLVLTVAGFYQLDTALIPEVHQGEFELELTLPVGTPLEETLRVVAPLEEIAVADPRVERVVLKVGADPEGDIQPEEGEHTARLSVMLAPPILEDGILGRVGQMVRNIVASLVHAGSGGAAAIREEEVIADLREHLAVLPDLQAKITRPVLFSFRTPIEVEVETWELSSLRFLGETVLGELEQIEGLSDVKTTARSGSPEVQITYDRAALVRLGLDLQNVADLVRTKVKGSTATEYRKKERRIDILVRLEEEDRTTVRQLRNLVVNPGATIPVPLSAVAQVDIAAGPADIRRVGQRRTALVQANISGGGLGQVSKEIRERLSAMSWPENASWRLAGQVQEMEQSSRSLWLALLLSVFLVYVVMASQFESLLHPLLIMVTVPLAMFGVVVLLVVLSIPLSVVVFLGMIMLAGIVVNNAIVMVDYVNTLRSRGLALEEALVEAGTVRLRPILMTTATTVLGLLPMAAGLGDGAEIRTPMALTVIAGLISSTLLTLVVLPTLYALVESGRERLKT
jgi:multidrug efflux pump subunit AcrB